MRRARWLFVLGAVGCTGQTPRDDCYDLHICDGDLNDGGSDAGPLDGEAQDAGADQSVADGSIGADGSDGSVLDGPPGCDATKSPLEDTCVIDDAFAIFVAPSGNDANPGTKAAPVKTLSAGITLAKTKSGKRVYACAATYAEPIALSAGPSDYGVTLFGGFACPGSDAGAAWSYASSRQAAVVAPGPAYALRIDGTTKPVRIEDMAFTVSDASAPSASSIAAFVSNSASVMLRRVSLTAGSAAGATGISGQTPATTLPVATKGSDGTAGGAEVTCACPNGTPSIGGKGGTALGNGDAGKPALGGGAGGDALKACQTGGRGGVGAAGGVAAPGDGA